MAIRLIIHVPPKVGVLIRSYGNIAKGDAFSSGFRRHAGIHDYRQDTCDELFHGIKTGFILQALSKLEITGAHHIRDRIIIQIAIIILGRKTTCDICTHRGAAIQKERVGLDGQRHFKDTTGAGTGCHQLGQVVHLTGLSILFQDFSVPGKGVGHELGLGNAAEYRSWPFLHGVGCLLGLGRRRSNVEHKLRVHLSDFGVNFPHRLTLAGCGNHQTTQ